MAGLHTRWFKWRFSLRTALVAILLLSLFLAWYAYKRRGLVAQAALVRDIRRCGGKAGGNLYGPQETRWRQFLLLSEDDFGNVVSVNLDDVQGVDAILPRLALFPQLKYLHLSGSDVTDEGLARLSGCQRVESLWLQRTKNLSGGGLSCLTRMPIVTDLVLCQSQIGSAAIEQIASANLKYLDQLSLQRTQWDDRWLAILEQMKRPLILDVVGTNVTEVGIANLENANRDIRIKHGFQATESAAAVQIEE